MAGMKILIIDDDRSIAQTFAFQMRTEGFEVETAEDGEQGWEKILSFKPNLIVLELVLLKKDGFEILKELKKRKDEHASVPVVIFSKLHQESDIAEARKLGAVEYFNKSDATLKRLIDKIKTI